MVFDCRTGADAKTKNKDRKDIYVRTNPNPTSQEWLVAQPIQNQLRAYSAVTGTWASLGVAVDTGDTFW
jgi:hypothetical protein